MNSIENESKDENYSSDNNLADSFSSCYSNLSDIQEIENVENNTEKKIELDIEGQENKRDTQLWDYVEDKIYLTEFGSVRAFEQIICVELINNNKIYVNYKSDWTLRDNKETMKLYSSRDYIENSKFMKKVFDFKLIIYRSVKDEKVDLNIRIKNLENLGFLKSPRFPFLYLHDSRNFNNITKNKKFIKTLYENSIKNNNYKVLTHQDLIYRDYLPRCFVSYLPSNCAVDNTELYTLSKRCFINFNKIILDALIGDKIGQLDWFVYDDESLNFLMKMENSEFVIDSNIKTINNKIFFQDKLQFIALSSKEVRHIFININLNSEIKMKIEVSLSTVGKEILRKVNQKLMLSYPELVFDPERKVLKVLGLSDYILDQDEPIGIFTYINQCIKNNTVPEYIVIDSPYFYKENELKDSMPDIRPRKGVMQKRRSSSLNLNDLAKIQAHNMFTSQLNRQHVNKVGSIIPHPTAKITDNKINTQGNIFLKKVPNDPKTITNPMIQLMNKNIFTNNDKRPVVLNINKDEKMNTNSNKKRFDNIAVFNVNENILEFSELKGIRRRNPIENRNNMDQVDITSKEENELNTIYVDKMIQKSIEEKLKNQNQDNKNSLQTMSVEVDADELVVEKQRSRSKGISKKPFNLLGENSLSKKRNDSTKIMIPNKDNTNNLSLNNLYTKNTDIDKYEDFITQMNSNIQIRNILRPFNIKLNILKINNHFLKSVFNLKNRSGDTKSMDRIIVFEMASQIFCGNEPISHKIKIIKNGTIDSFSNINFNTLINFNLKYSDLPLFSNLVVKLNSFVKIKNETKKRTIAWVNFRLFDHLKRLKTGQHKISFWETRFSDESFFSSIDNNKSNTGELYFQIESFMRPVEYNDDYENEIKNTTKEISILATDEKIIENISKKTLFEDLTPEEKEVLWRNRYTVVNNQELICKLFKCVNKRDVKQLKETEKLIQICKFVSLIQALQLLNGDFLNEPIRRFAVESLAKVSPLEINDYLIQLVQSLKYEVYHDSFLARFLLKLGIKYPLTIGHSLFWNLKSEMHNTNVQQRFGLYLEIFLSKIGSNLRKIFEDEVYLVNSLSKVCDIAFYKDKNITKDEIKLKFENELEKINENLLSDREISIPFNYRLKVKRILIKKCKFMKSKKKPLWLAFENACDLAEDAFVMYKKGDDLRQDIITLQLFKIMHKLWYEEGLKLKMSNYEVISTGYFEGLLQIVTNSETLATIQKDYGGLLSGFSTKPLKHWMCKIITNITEKEYVNNFILSTVAYCLGTFVLGIGDRHNDNIMVKKNGELFHIDFGHFLGHFKYKYGIKRERAPFIFTTEFCNVIGGEKSENFENFKFMCVDSYRVIRKNANVLITILNSLLCSGIPELTCNSISKSILNFLEFLEYSLALGKNDTEAEAFLLQKLKDSLNSFSTKLNFAIHIMANK